MKRAWEVVVMLLIGVVAAVLLVVTVVRYHSSVYGWVGGATVLWHDPPSLDSVFPQERAAAAKAAADKYGAKP